MTTTDTQTPQVIVIGAGLAGLTAAVHLAERGVKPLVLEANQVWLGGRLAGGEPETFSHAGREWSFPSEHGIHGLWGGYMNMRATLQRFIADDTLAPQASEGEVWINRWGETVTKAQVGTVVRRGLLPAPFHYLNLLFSPRFYGTITPIDFLSLPGVLFSMGWTVGTDPLREKSALDGLTIDDYFTLWTPNFRATIEGVARNMLAAPDEAITLTGLIAALRFYTVLRRDDWHPYFFPANSRTAVIDPLETAITARGGVVLRGMTAKCLERTGNGWRVHVTDATGTATYTDAPHVILAAHSGATHKILAASADTREQALQTRYPQMLRNTVVRLWFSRDADDTAPSGMFTGDFVPDNYFWLHRIHREFAAWGGDGGSAIELHFYGDAALLDQPDKHFMVMGVNEVVRAWPELKGAFVHGSVRRNSKVHTAFRVMTDDMLHVETPWQNVWACGDWVGYDTPSLWMERACTTGIAAANGVLAATGKPGYAVLQPNPPELPVRVVSAGVHGLRKLFGPVVKAGRALRKGK
ncbi:MAG: FAD-dependent oxidoreductase [Chloroflexota bacterium]